MHQLTDGGLNNVWLKNGYTEHRTVYGPGISFQDADGLIRTTCIALCKQPGKLTSTEFNYVRNALLLSKADFGTKLGFDNSAFVQWELNGEMPPEVDELLRTMILDANFLQESAATNWDYTLEGKGSIRDSSCAQAFCKQFRIWLQTNKQAKQAAAFEEFLP